MKQIWREDERNHLGHLHIAHMHKLSLARHDRDLYTNKSIILFMITRRVTLNFVAGEDLACQYRHQRFLDRLQQEWRLHKL